MKASLFILTMLCMFAYQLRAQNNDRAPQEPYQIVEQMPQFPGGQEAMMKFIAENIVYPSLALDIGVSGRVVATFVVDTSGRSRDVKILSGNPFGLDEEVLQIVRLMPNWTAGKRDGIPVPMQLNLPVMFDLQDGKKSSPPRSVDFNEPRYPEGYPELLKFIRTNFNYKNLDQTYTKPSVRLALVIDDKGTVKNTELGREIDQKDRKEIHELLVKKLRTFIPGTIEGKKGWCYYYLDFPLHP